MARGRSRGDCRAGSPALQGQEYGELESLITYLQARQAWIPNYRQRRIEQQYIGSGQVEKANDLLVARRQTARGMPWRWDTRAAGAALRTLMVTRGRDQSWQQRQGLPRTSS